MSALIEVSELSKTFHVKGKVVRAVDDVSFIVEAGEAFGFVGPNGAGKSTTIKILLGILGDYTGRVLLNGIPADEGRSRHGVGYLPESAALPEVLTPLDILMNAVLMHGVAAASPRALCKEWLERFSVAQVADRRIRELSKGTVQRVALAHAMVVGPRLLILDEPLSGLDPIGRKDVVDIIADYRRDGGTIFFTSHVLHDVERVADRFALIHKGQIRTVRSPAELVGGEQMLLVRSVGREAVAGMQPEGEGRWHREVSSEDLWPLLEALRAAGHALSEVRPALSLESAFMHFVGGDNPLAGYQEPEAGHGSRTSA